MGEQMTFPNTWEEFEECYGFTDKEQIYTNGSRLIQSFRVEQWLDHLPSAQKKGKWIHDGYDFTHGCDWIHCSICGKRGINVPADLTNFCPNCGADMRGEQNGFDQQTGCD